MGFVGPYAGSMQRSGATRGGDGASEPPRPPRQLPRRGASFGAKLTLLWGGICLTLGLPTLAVFLLVGEPFWADLTLDARGVQTDATVLRVERRNTKGTDRTAPDIEVRYRDKEGKEHRGVVRTRRSALILRAVGEKRIFIEYDPHEPALCRAKGGSASLFGYSVFIPAPVALLGLLLLGWGWRGVVRSRSLYRDGAAVLATVTEVRPTRMSRNGRPILDGRYSFALPQGRFSGRRKSEDLPKVGGAIWVIHDPSDPRRNLAWEELRTVLLPKKRDEGEGRARS